MPFSRPARVSATVTPSRSSSRAAAGRPRSRRSSRRWRSGGRRGSGARPSPRGSRRMRPCRGSQATRGFFAASRSKARNSSSDAVADPPGESMSRTTAGTRDDSRSLFARARRAPGRPGAAADRPLQPHDRHPADGEEPPQARDDGAQPIGVGGLSHGRRPPMATGTSAATRNPSPRTDRRLEADRLEDQRARSRLIQVLGSDAIRARYDDERTAHPIRAERDIVEAQGGSAARQRVATVPSPARTRTAATASTRRSRQARPPRG